LVGLGGPDDGDTFGELPAAFEDDGGRTVTTLTDVAFDVLVDPFKRDCFGRPAEGGRACGVFLLLLLLVVEPPTLLALAVLLLLLLTLDLDREGEDATMDTALCLSSEGAPRPRNGDAATLPLELLLLWPALLLLLLPPVPLRSRLLLLPLAESLLSLRSLVPRDNFRSLEPPGLQSTERPRPGVALRCFTRDGRGAGLNSPFRLDLFWFSWLACPSDGTSGGASSMKLMEARKELATEMASECTEGAVTLPSPMPMEWLLSRP